MRSVLSDTKPISDAAASAAATIREALDHVPMPDTSRLPDAGDLPDLADLGDSVAGLVGSVGDVAGKTAGVVTGATTAALRRFGIIRSPHRRRSLVIGGIVLIGVATAAMVFTRRSRSAGADHRARDRADDRANATDSGSDAATPRVAAVS